MNVFDSSKSRIHQALAAAGWDVSAVGPISDLGVPYLMTQAPLAKEMPPSFWDGDFGNGLFVMIDVVAHVLVFADLLLEK